MSPRLPRDVSGAGARPGLCHLDDLGHQNLVSHGRAKRKPDLPASKPFIRGHCPTVTMEELPHQDGWIIGFWALLQERCRRFALFSACKVECLRNNPS